MKHAQVDPKQLLQERINGLRTIIFNKEKMIMNETESINNLYKDMKILEEAVQKL